MKLFDNIIDQTRNWLPQDGTANYYSKLFTATETNYLEKLLDNIEWLNPHKNRLNLKLRCHIE